MDATVWETSGVPQVSYIPRARIPKSLVATNWPCQHQTSTTTGRTQRVCYSAWDNTTVVSPDTTQSISLHDAYHTTFLLRQLLVPDVVPLIIHYAGIFTRSSYCKKHDLAVPRRQSPHMFIVTPPIYSPVRLRYPVTAVIFTIVARDQGLDLNIGRSYFTAGILRNAERDRSEDLDQADSFAMDVFDGERVVVKNTPAMDVYEEHIVEWRADSGNAEEAAWVAGLTNGDRIAVSACAQWASFENRVSKVEVALYTAAVVE